MTTTQDTRFSTGSAMRMLRDRGVKTTRRRLEYLFDTNPEVKPELVAGRLLWSSADVANVSEALAARGVRKKQKPATA